VASDRICIGEALLRRLWVEWPAALDPAIQASPLRGRSHQGAMRLPARSRRSCSGTASCQLPAASSRARRVRASARAGHETALSDSNIQADASARHSRMIEAIGSAPISFPTNRIHSMRRVAPTPSIATSTATSFESVNYGIAECTHDRGALYASLSLFVRLIFSGQRQINERGTLAIPRAPPDRPVARTCQALPRRRARRQPP